MWTWLFGWYWWFIEQIRGSWLWSQGPLFNTAQYRAEEISRQTVLSHDGFSNALLPANCSRMGEVIGKTTGDEMNVFNAWLQSPSHYAILVDQGYNSIGYGLAYAGGWLYMVIHTAWCW